jgi:hypothetical protein
LITSRITSRVMMRSFVVRADSTMSWMPFLILPAKGVKGSSRPVSSVSSEQQAYEGADAAAFRRLADCECADRFQGWRVPVTWEGRMTNEDE